MTAKKWVQLVVYGFLITFVLGTWRLLFLVEAELDEVKQENAELKAELEQIDKSKSDCEAIMIKQLLREAQELEKSVGRIVDFLENGEE